MNFYQFASQHPWLTFFLFLIVGETIEKVAQAIFGHKESSNDD